MLLLRHELGERGKLTSMRQFARELGIIPQRYYKWEKVDSFPGRAFLSSCLARLASVKARGLDPVALAAWADLGPDDQPPPLDPPGSAAALNGEPLDASLEPAEVDADIIRFDELVEQVGYLAQKRVYEAAITGDKIPEDFQELVRAALDLREVSIKSLAAPTLPDGREATARPSQERTDSRSVAA